MSSLPIMISSSSSISVLGSFMYDRKKRSWSTFLGSRAVLLMLNVKPASENERSDEAEAAGIDDMPLATFLILGWAFDRHNPRASDH